MLRISNILGGLIVLLAGCASFEPEALSGTPLLERAVAQESDGVSVLAAVPSAAETKDLFSRNLYRKGVQPVWIKIRNSTDQDIVFAPIGIDSNYRLPIEVALLSGSKKDRIRAERYFFESGMEMVLEPGQTRSGFVFTNLDEGTKAFNVDLYSEQDSWRFTFFIPVPGLKIDHHTVDFDALYTPEEIHDHTTLESLARALEDLPCCTRSADGSEMGDPLNIVLVGEPDDLYYAVLRAGWNETESVSVASGFKTAMSFLTGGRYRYSPVSSLYVFGRAQDVALQRIRENINERNHFRAWLSPLRYRGRPVWVGQISRDIGVRFTTKTITTHKIDPDVDETREFLIENLAYSGVVEMLAYVGGVGEATADEPRPNLTGDPYYTDGLRAIIWIAEAQTDISQLRYIGVLGTGGQ